MKKKKKKKKETLVVSFNGGLMLGTWQDYDATIEFYWAPLLAESNSDAAVEHRLEERVIRGAPMDRHSRFWKGADVLVFNSYLWWTTGTKIQIL